MEIRRGILKETADHVRQDSLEIIIMWQVENYRTTSHLLSSTCYSFYSILSALENHYFSALTEVRKRRRRQRKKLRNDEQVRKESQKEPEFSTKNVRRAAESQHCEQQKTSLSNETQLVEDFEARIFLFNVGPQSVAISLSVRLNELQSS